MIFFAFIAGLAGLLMLWLAYEHPWGMRKFMLIAIAINFFVYVIYEIAMWHWEQTVRNPIRVDVFLIFPHLVVIGIVGLSIGLSNVARSTNNDCKRTR